MGLTPARVALGVLLLSLGWPAAAGEILTGHVTPISAFAPRDIVVHAIIEPDDRNRSLSIVIDSGSFYTSSTVALEGNRAPRAKDVTFRMLPAGWYDIQVTLSGVGGERASFTRAIELF